MAPDLMAPGPNGTRTSAKNGLFDYPCGEFWSLRARPILAALIRMRAPARADDDEVKEHLNADQDPAAVGPRRNVAKPTVEKTVMVKYKALVWSSGWLER